MGLGEGEGEGGGGRGGEGGRRRGEVAGELREGEGEREVSSTI